MVAFAVDTGALYQERRELQNGADAAAIAIAEDCALGSKPCTTPQAMATAQSFADANAADSAATVDTVNLDTAAKTVAVAVSTKRSDGGTIFRPFFAQVVGFDGTTVHAGASAAWGYPSGLATFPIIISECEWDRETNSGASLHDDDVLPPPAGTPTLLKFHSGNALARHDDCAAQAGQDADGDGRLPGGFGWLDTGGNDCVAEVTEDFWVDTDPGSSPSNGCSAATVEDELLNKIVFIPWFDDLQGTGANRRVPHCRFRGSVCDGIQLRRPIQGAEWWSPLLRAAPLPGGLLRRDHPDLWGHARRDRSRTARREVHRLTDHRPIRVLPHPVGTKGRVPQARPFVAHSSAQVGSLIT